MHRQAGVVLPLFSIRTRRDWGIGQVSDLPMAAAWIRRAGHKLLQVLPPHELSAGETSPYGALTAFGVDPIYLDVTAVEDLDTPAIEKALGEEGKKALERARAASSVDYSAVRPLKTRVMRAAFDRFFEREWSRGTPRAAKLAQFMREESGWLDDLALYTAIRDSRGGWGWESWSENHRDRAPQALQKVRADHGQRLVEVAYVQWLLNEQWQQAHSQMREVGVELMGDIPFVVCAESADVWSHASQFQLHVSLGAPPDDYSVDGQDWGLPAYDWLAMEADSFAWLRARTRHAARLYDRFRLDHVVGYFRQWVRRKGGRDRGRFDPEGVDAQRARGLRVLGAILDELSQAKESVGPPRAIAEDLGVIPPFVRDVLGQLGLPGYRVLPWEKDAALFRDPRAFPTSSVASWSTHDTAPIDRWWDDFSDDDRKFLAARAGAPAEASAEVRSLALIGDLQRSSSGMTLVLAQELLGLKDRINVPGTVGGQNWSWRLPKTIEDLETDPTAIARLDAIRQLTLAAGREGLAALSVEPGNSHPLGATREGRGVHFSLFSQHATGVCLCLFDDAGHETRVVVPWRSLHVWHVYVPGLAPGQRYGWRVEGPFAPQQGHRFNSHKLLVDPYARALDGQFDIDAPVYGYPRERFLDDLSFDERDDAYGKPKGVVIDETFDWGDERAPSVPWRDTVLYELHVRGLTRRHPLVPPEQRGTFLGLASDAAIAHFESLGVTTLELMPVQERLDEPALTARGMTNYWGYNTLAFFAPDRRFATAGGAPWREFKQMVKKLHSRGIEVVLDVVYNHSCEGDAMGPTVSFRGIDNRVYYRLDPLRPREYIDYSGCGNTLDATHPQVLKLVMDSLRYWVTEMKVDGFRFDLAPALARGESGDVDRVSAFFAVVHQDPVLSRIKLIAEPWDLGAGGYQVGSFPVLWSEWNGRFRDTVRRFWRGERKVVADFGYRLSGSSDLFGDDGRGPRASINFVTAHDGFTLRDLVSYEKKHNEANGERNRDGWDDNESQNCGVEGETIDPRVKARRRTLARSLMATLFLSQGVPMLEMGDELWRTQRGNNNPYCHDSELTWVDWRLDEDGHAMLEVAQALAAFRERHVVFRRTKFFRGERVRGSRGRDIVWLRPDGAEMTRADWEDPTHAALAFRLDGEALEGDGGEPLRDASFLVLMNGERQETTFGLPSAGLGDSWRVVVDTREKSHVGDATLAGGAIVLDAGSLVVLTEASSSA